MHMADVLMTPIEHEGALAEVVREIKWPTHTHTHTHTTHTHPSHYSPLTNMSSCILGHKRDHQRVSLGLLRTFAFHTHSAFESFQTCCFCSSCFSPCKIGFNLHSMPSLFMFVFATPPFTTAKWFKTPSYPDFCECKNYQIKHSMPILFLNPYKHVVFYSPSF